MKFISIRVENTLKFALLIMGLTATTIQILIIREFLVAFHGNELTIGVILGNWLILEAIGSYFVRKRAEYTRNEMRTFVALQTLLGLACPLTIILIRSFKYALGIPLGEVLGVPYVLIISFMLMSPIAIIDGALFTFGCRNFATLVAKDITASGKVYLYQGLGAFAGGAIFTFYLVYYFDSIQVACLIALLNFIAIAFFTTSYFKTGMRQGDVVRLVASILMVGTCLVLIFSISKKVHTLSSRVQWHEYSLVETKNSVYANIAVIKEEEQFTFFTNGSPYATTPIPDIGTAEEIAHFSLLFHPNPQKILIIGGGAGGLLSEILKHPVTKVDYIEQDPLVIECLRRFKTPVTEYELTHPKVRLHFIDGRLFIRTTKEKYDIIIVNLPPPSTLQLNRYYTVEFFRLLSLRLNSGGLISSNLLGSEVFLSTELRQLNNNIYVSLTKTFPYSRLIIGNLNLFLASTDFPLDHIEARDLIDRMHARNIETRLVNDLYINYKMDESRFGPLKKEIVTSGVGELNQDTHPWGVFYNTLFWNSLASPKLVQVFYTLKGIGLRYYLGFLAILAFTLGFIRRHRQKWPNIHLTFAIASTGFASMVFSTLLIFLFQVFYGYIYHKIGLLTATFMLGMAIGTFIILRGLQKKSPSLSQLVKIEIAIAILAGFIFIFASVFSRLPNSQIILSISQQVIFVLIIVAGLLTGMEFPLATKLSDMSSQRISITAGRIYAADLLGAFWGAILTAVIFFPILGVWGTLVLVLALKLSSLYLIYSKPLRY